LRVPDDEQVVPETDAAGAADVTAAVGEPKTNPEENAEMSSPTDAEAERDEEPQR
jgi:hypothetical protein